VWGLAWQRGEILVAGNNVTQHGYYKLPKETAEAFILHPDGKIWFHTGDIGVMEEDGVLKIVDRKKDLIKLQGGEYVSLGKVEANLKQVKGIGQCCVFAQSHQTFCVCIVSQPEKGWESVGGRPQEAVLVAEIESKMKELGLARFEIPTKVKVDDEIWTPESGLVTASFKVQRNTLRQFYNKPGGLLDQMGYRFPE
jgi:long-chain acyl-CoA synthetase